MSYQNIGSRHVLLFRHKARVRQGHRRTDGQNYDLRSLRPRLHSCFRGKNSVCYTILRFCLRFLLKRHDCHHHCLSYPNRITCSVVVTYFQYGGFRRREAHSGFKVVNVNHLPRTMSNRTLNFIILSHT